jgi:hypothetical protein
VTLAAWAGDLRKYGLIPSRARDLLLFQNTLTSSKAPLASYSIGTTGSIFDDKAAGA